MQGTELYPHILGRSSPWSVGKVTWEDEASRLMCSEEVPLRFLPARVFPRAKISEEAGEILPAVD